MKTTVAIPARLNSARFPGKALAEINGRPMLWHVWSRSKQARLVDSVAVVTDSRAICDLVRSWGGHALLSSPRCECGTERIASVLEDLAGDFFLNVQADVAALRSELLDELVDALVADPTAVVTPVYRIRCFDELQNPDRVKVVRANDGRALYFSRSPIPYLRDVDQEQWCRTHEFWGHVGVYGMSRSLLAEYPAMSPSRLEYVEKLEQLRFLSEGYRVQTIETRFCGGQVDSADDLALVQAAMAFDARTGGEDANRDR